MPHQNKIAFELQFNALLFWKRVVQQIIQINETYITNIVELYHE